MVGKTAFSRLAEDEARVIAAVLGEIGMLARDVSATKIVVKDEFGVVYSGPFDRAAIERSIGHTGTTRIVIHGREGEWHESVFHHGEGADVFASTTCSSEWSWVDGYIRNAAAESLERITIAGCHEVVLTERLYDLWVRTVSTGMTERGLRQWVRRNVTLDDYMLIHGTLVIQERDERALPGVSGSLQVSMFYDRDNISTRALRDMWIRVSDDRSELERAAIARIAVNYPAHIWPGRGQERG